MVRRRDNWYARPHLQQHSERVRSRLVRVDHVDTELPHQFGNSLHFTAGKSCQRRLDDIDIFAVTLIRHPPRSSKDSQLMPTSG